MPNYGLFYRNFLNPCYKASWFYKICPIYSFRKSITVPCFHSYTITIYNINENIILYMFSHKVFALGLTSSNIYEKPSSFNSFPFTFHDCFLCFYVLACDTLYPSQSSLTFFQPQSGQTVCLFLCLSHLWPCSEA